MVNDDTGTPVKGKTCTEGDDMVKRTWCSADREEGVSVRNLSRTIPGKPVVFDLKGKIVFNIKIVYNMDVVYGNT